jgi:hypothetical protein
MDGIQVLDGVGGDDVAAVAPTPRTPRVSPREGAFSYRGIVRFSKTVTVEWLGGEEGRSDEHHFRYLCTLYSRFHRCVNEFRWKSARLWFVFHSEFLILVCMPGRDS